jgi:hypothetical protein
MPAVFSSSQSSTVVIGQLRQTGVGISSGYPPRSNPQAESAVKLIVLAQALIQIKENFTGEVDRIGSCKA